MPKSISNRSAEATERTNTTGILTPILEIQPEEGLGLVLKGMVAQGDEDGIPIYLDLKDSNGNPLPVDTTVAIQFEAPGDDNRTTVSHPLTNIRPYNTLSVNEQQNKENIDQVKHVLKGTKAAKQNGGTPKVGISDVDTAFISIESSKQIDWANSRAYIDRNAVEQVS